MYAKALPTDGRIGACSNGITYVHRPPRQEDKLITVTAIGDGVVEKEVTCRPHRAQGPATTLVLPLRL